MAIRAIEEALELSDGRLTVLLHGGEPTLFFDFIERLVTDGEQIADRLHKTVEFAGQTNLSRLSARMVSFSMAHRISWGVSLDGGPALNDRFRVLRNGEGTYSRFEAARREFPAFVERCGIMTTVTAATQDALLGIARHFRDLGLHSWAWSLFQPIGMGRAQEEEFAFSTSRVIASWNQMLDAVEGGEFDGFAVLPVSDYIRNMVVGPGPNMCMRTQCGAARDLMSVSSNGTIEACDCIDRKGPLANLGVIQIQTRDSLLRARQSEKADLIRSRNVEVGNCGSCTWLSVCGGTCLAHAGSVHGIWQAQCEIAMGMSYRRANNFQPSRWVYGPNEGPFYNYIVRMAAGASLAQTTAELTARTRALAERDLGALNAFPFVPICSLDWPLPPRSERPRCTRCRSSAPSPDCSSCWE